MSELINTHDNRATIRWKLLTGASALALTAYVSSTSAGTRGRCEPATRSGSNWAAILASSARRKNNSRRPSSLPRPGLCRKKSLRSASEMCCASASTRMRKYLSSPRIRTGFSRRASVSAAPRAARTCTRNPIRHSLFFRRPTPHADPFWQYALPFSDVEKTAPGNARDSRFPGRQGCRPRQVRRGRHLDTQRRRPVCAIPVAVPRHIQDATRLACHHRPLYYVPIFVVLLATTYFTQNPYITFTSHIPVSGAFVTI